MTNQMIDYKTLQSLQRQLDESDANMAKRMGVKHKHFLELKSGDKTLNESHLEMIESLIKQVKLDQERASTRDLVEKLGYARHKLAADLNVKPSRIKLSVESDNDPLLKKVLALHLDHPELNLIEKLSHY